LAHTTKI